MTDVASREKTSEPGTQALTISAAARTTGLDRRTIRRQLDSGRFPGAFRGSGSSGMGTGAWLIPVDDLRHAGLLPGDRHDRPARHLMTPNRVDSELDRLRAELAEAVRRAEAAEAALVERDRLIEAQRDALAGVDPGADHHGHHGSPSVEYDHHGQAPQHLGDEQTGASLDWSSGPDKDEQRLPGDPDQPEVPLFASSWASAPPWDHSPPLATLPQQRWWQRLTVGLRSPTSAAPADPDDQRSSGSAKSKRQPACRSLR